MPEKRIFPTGLIITEDLKRTTDEDAAAIKAYPTHTIDGLSTSTDLRNINGKNYVTPIQDQGSCGSCVSFGSTAVLESTKMFMDQMPQEDDIKRSEWDLFSAIGSCAGGSTLEKANSRLQSVGVCAERCYPYNADGPSPCCAQTRMKILSAIRVTSDAQAKDLLSKGFAIQFAMDVMTDYFDYDSGVYHYEYGDLAGGHCQAIIGYDDTKGAWLVKNSWSTAWGLSGFAYVGYGECGILRSYAGYAYNVGQPVPVNLACAITPKPANMTIDGSVALNGNPQGGAPPYTSEWTGDTQGLSCFTCPTPMFKAASTGTYHLMYVVTDSKGAVASDRVDVVVSAVPADIVLPVVGVVSLAPYLKPMTPAHLFVNGSDLGLVPSMVKYQYRVVGKFGVGDGLTFSLVDAAGKVYRGKGYSLIQKMGSRLWVVQMRIKTSGSYPWQFYVKEASVSNSLDDLRKEAFDQEVERMMEDETRDDVGTVLRAAGLIGETDAKQMMGISGVSQ